MSETTKTKSKTKLPDTDYKWLEGSSVKEVTPAKEAILNRELDEINKQDWQPAQKNLYAKFLYEQLSAQAPLPAVINKKVGLWGKNKELQAMARTYCEDSMEKFRIAGMVSVMCATLVFYFAKAMFTSDYVVNFSVDALVAVIAVVFLIRNLQIKYKLTSSFSKSKEFLVLDLLSALLCMLLKISLPAQFDVSLIILVAAYFVEKKKFALAEDAVMKNIDNKLSFGTGKKKN